MSPSLKTPKKPSVRGDWHHPGQILHSVPLPTPLILLGQTPAEPASVPQVGWEKEILVCAPTPTQPQTVMKFLPLARQDSKVLARFTLLSGLPQFYVTFIWFYIVCISPWPGASLRLEPLFSSQSCFGDGGWITQDKGCLCCGYAS